MIFRKVKFACNELITEAYMQIKLYWALYKSVPLGKFL
jgi:hypothetical protein